MTIVTRASKGSALTWEEMDANFLSIMDASSIHAATEKTTPEDQDEFLLLDNDTSFGVKKTTWADKKATLKTYFDSYYLSSVGDLLIATPGARIKGDFSNATVANRVMFQTSTVNGNTTVAAIPNGTGTLAALQSWGGSDLTNSSYSYIATIGGSDVRLAADRTGAGAYLPMTFYTNGSEQMRVDTAGKITVSKVAINTPVTDNDLSFDMSAKNNFTCTPTAGGALTFTNITAGQSGYIVLVNGSNYAITKGTGTKSDSSFLTTVSATGTYLISYYSPDGTNVYVATSGAQS